MLVVPLEESLIPKLNSRDARDFITIRAPFVVDTFSKTSGARQAGLLKNDTIIGVNDTTTRYYNEFVKFMKNRKAGMINLKFIRAGDTLTKEVQLDENGKIGAYPKTLKALGFKYETKTYNFLEAVPAGFKECWVTLGRYVTGLRQLFTGKAKASESLGSVLSIGGIYPQFCNWQIFWSLTAIFSIILAFMNILPIPGLDGGHALFTLAEMISGRKPSDKFLEYSQMVGMVLLMALMAYALGLDVWRLFK